MVIVAQHLRGTIEGGIALLRAAVTAAPPRPRRPSRLSACFALLPEAGFVPASPPEPAEATATQAAVSPPQGSRTASRARTSRPATRRPGGARRPAAKGGRGRGRSGAAAAPCGGRFILIESFAWGGAMRLPVAGMRRSVTLTERDLFAQTIHHERTDPWL